MNASEPTRSRPPRGGQGRQRPLDAWKTFALLAVVVAGAGHALGRVADARSTAPTSLGSAGKAAGVTELGAAEAVRRFRELDRLLRRAYFERDATLVSMFIHPESALDETVVDEIGLLLRKRVLDRADIRTVSLRVVSSSERALVVRQRITERARFVTESGEDVTASRQPIWEVVDWTLRPHGTDWKIFSSDVVGGGALRGRS